VTRFVGFALTAGSQGRADPLRRFAGGRAVLLQQIRDALGRLIPENAKAARRTAR
jgi:hypothetical protein